MNIELRAMTWLREVVLGATDYEAMSALACLPAALRVGFDRVARTMMPHVIRVGARVMRYSPPVVRSWARQQYLGYAVRMRPRLVPEERLERTFEGALRLLAESGQPRPLGDYLEFGVYNGSSLACMHRVVQRTKLEGMRLFGFDTFDGLPAEEVDPESPWRAGEFRSELNFTRAVLAREGVDWNQVVLVPGRFEESLTQSLRFRYGISTLSVAMIDCDLYRSAKQALAFCGPLIVGKAVMVFDDWPTSDTGYQGEKAAFEEFLASSPALKAKPLPELSYAANSAVFLVTHSDDNGQSRDVHGQIPDS
jgi:O-methyltransferase